MCRVLDLHIPDPQTHAAAAVPPHPRQVRVGVLEREKAELDDRVGALETQLAATDKLAAQDFATKVRAGRGERCRGGSALGHTH